MFHWNLEGKALLSYLRMQMLLLLLDSTLLHSMHPYACSDWLCFLAPTIPLTTTVGSTARPTAESLSMNLFLNNISSISKHWWAKFSWVIHQTLKRFKGKLTVSHTFPIRKMLILWPSPQVDEKQLNHILRLVDDGKRDGTLVHGGSRYGNKVRPI